MKKNTSVVYSAIAISAVIAYCGFLFKGGVKETNKTEESVPLVTEESSVVFEETATSPSVEEYIPTATIKTDVPLPTEPSYEHFSPIFPVQGEIINKFSESLVYNALTDDWRSHSGIDIKAAKTERVLACEKGTVTRMFQDPLWGNVIEIDHGEYKSVYKNLSTLIMKNVGDVVEKGEPISGVGDSSAAEGFLGAHLHFEILKDSSFQDPLSFLDKND
jgi:murein DD-endopeptidase MepM/ murein hydrolase activator NlpD